MEYLKLVRLIQYYILLMYCYQLQWRMTLMQKVHQWLHRTPSTHWHRRDGAVGCRRPRARQGRGCRCVQRGHGAHLVTGRDKKLKNRIKLKNNTKQMTTTVQNTKQSTTTVQITKQNKTTVQNTKQNKKQYNIRSKIRQHNIIYTQKINKSIAK